MKAMLISKAVSRITFGNTPSITGATTDKNVQTSSGLVITCNPLDSQSAIWYKVTGITNGVLYKNDGVTAISENGYVTGDEGAAGLKFTPSSGYVGTGSFSIQASGENASDSGLGGDIVAASITVNAVASGGVITYVGSDTVHTFLASGELYIPASKTARVLVVAGGGAAGEAGGGGGAGGMIYNASFAINSGTYAVTVGAGGVGGPQDARSGENSVFSTLTAIGGGGGGSNSATPSIAYGKAGGSCGGSSNQTNRAACTSGQGNVGGYGFPLLGKHPGGGGGGAGQTGRNASDAHPGDGGNGLACDISGASVTYAGGGAGSGDWNATWANIAANGGSGGGGSSKNPALAGYPGTPNTGGGGGGNLASGGSGIVIVRYPT